MFVSQKCNYHETSGGAGRSNHHNAVNKQTVMDKDVTTYNTKLKVHTHPKMWENCELKIAQEMLGILSFMW